MTALTYHPDTAASGVRYVACPKCGYSARVDLHGDRLRVRCQGVGCADADVLAGLDTERVIAELRHHASGESPQASDNGHVSTPPVEVAPDRLTVGSKFILDAPDDVPAIWGDGQQVIWPKGEPLYIVAPPGAGKTTLGGQLALKRHGIGDNLLLGMPVEVDPRPVLYIAGDRPMQASRSFRRQVTEADRKGLEHFYIWPGPLPFDTATTPHGLAQWAKGMGVGTIFIDSLKDVMLDLASDEGGSRANLALQHCIAEELEVAVLHHQRKAGTDNRTPSSLDDVYGSTWLTAGAGSVVLLWGKPGDPIVDLRHLKQPAEEFGPVSIHHDHERGVSTLHEPNDLVSVAANSPGGLTVEYAARALFGTTDPDRNQREKARRRLETLRSEGKLDKQSGSPTAPAIYTPAALKVAA